MAHKPWISARTFANRYPDLKSAISADALTEVATEAGKAARYPVVNITWLPVIPNPDKILCIGLNYETHRVETGRAEVANPTVFGRFANSQTGHLSNIVRPRVSKDLDFEGELAVIIGKPGRYIAPKDPWATSQDTPVTTKAAFAIFSGTRISSRPARIFHRPVPLGPGW